MDEQSSKDLTAKFQNDIAMYDEYFTKSVVHLRKSLQKIAEKENNENFESLSNRLNYNNFYSQF